MSRLDQCSPDDAKMKSADCVEEIGSKREHMIAGRNAVGKANRVSMVVSNVSHIEFP